MRALLRAMVGTLTAVAAVVMTATAAQASYSNVVYVSDCSWCPEVGHGTFMADPAGNTPGDSIQACDISSDGWGIKVWLYNRSSGAFIRSATTQGHNAKYCTPWRSGNLPEETPVTIKVCKIKGTTVERCESEGATA